MKRYMHIAVLMALVLCTFAGCRSGSANNTTAGTASTTQATTNAGMDNMLPGPEDTIDSTNGANEPDSTRDTTTSEPTDTTGDDHSRVRPRPNRAP